MDALKKHNIEVSRCVRCGEPLKVFAAYLPDLGEVCMSCYVKEAKEREKLVGNP